MTNYDLQNTTQKTKDSAWTPPNTGDVGATRVHRTRR